MAFSKEKRRKIYDRTNGKCHICGKKLAFTNYGLNGSRGAWEVEHSNPRSWGGTDRLSNLYAACISCNRKKGDKTTRTARAKYGRKYAPLSKRELKEEKKNNAMKGGVIGGLIGSIAGPPGAIIGAALGAKLGYDQKVDDE